MKNENLEKIAEKMPNTYMFLLYAEIMPYWFIFNIFTSVIEILDMVTEVIEKENEGEEK